VDFAEVLRARSPTNIGEIENHDIRSKFPEKKTSRIDQPQKTFVG
jgi:hypothetical protein